MLDEVAYVRYASVYHRFHDVDSFRERARAARQAPAQRSRRPARCRCCRRRRANRAASDDGAGPTRRRPHGARARARAPRPLDHRPEPARRLRDRRRRARGRRGLARARGRAARGGRGACGGGRRGARRDRLRDARALLPPRPHAALRRRAHRRGHRAASCTRCATRIRAWTAAASRGSPRRASPSKAACSSAKRAS